MNGPFTAYAWWTGKGRLAHASEGWPGANVALSWLALAHASDLGAGAGRPNAFYDAGVIRTLTGWTRETANLHLRELASLGLVEQHPDRPLWRMPPAARDAARLAL